jgi:hypothetical protein
MVFPQGYPQQPNYAAPSTIVVTIPAKVEGITSLTDRTDRSAVLFVDGLSDPDEWEMEFDPPMKLFLGLLSLPQEIHSNCGSPRAGPDFVATDKGDGQEIVELPL